MKEIILTIQAEKATIASEVLVKQLLYRPLDLKIG